MIAVPSSTGRWILAVAVATWAGAYLGLRLLDVGLVAAIAGAAVVAFGALWQRSAGLLVLGGFLVAGAVSGSGAAHRAEATLSAPIPEGRVAVQGRVVEDTLRLGEDDAFLLDPDALLEGDRPQTWYGPRLVVVGDVADIEVAARVVVTGRLRWDPRLVRGDPVAGRLDAGTVRILAPSSQPILRLGNALRSRIRHQLRPQLHRPEAALLSGFLIGDVAHLPRGDVEALRSSGLSHFVAVSGSNVALFLSVWWLAVAPLAVRPRARAIVGLIGLAIFVVATRWESSVLRASVMVGLVLVGRFVGVPLGGWEALGGAVTLLLLSSGQLATDVGFQLSVAATAGILGGVTAFAGRRPRWMWATLGATVSAQFAVVPLLLTHFGSVPLLAPLTNVLAAPLVVTSTLLGGLGVVSGFGPLLDLSLLLAKVVLLIARKAAEWPQLGWLGVTAVLTGVLVWRTRLRVVVPVVATFALVLTLTPPQPPRTAIVTFLDVGQGDAVLLRDPGGRVVLVDGGRRPEVLASSLRQYGVGNLDLLVITHGDADHVGGLSAVAGSTGVHRLWHSGHPNPGPELAGVIDQVATAGGRVEVPTPGTKVRAGAFTIEVLGPRRRFLSENDASVVLLVEACDRSMLLAGDIEAVAQRELPQLHPDVLMVPHHGAATTDLDWLSRTVADLAVVSVGENSYGHPAPEVMEVLDESAAEIRVTHEDGDIHVACPS